MNKIYRNLIAVFMLVTCMLFTSLSVGMIRSDLKEEKQSLTEIVDQIMANIDIAKTSYYNKLDLMEGVWLDRAKDAAYLLMADEKLQSEEALGRIRTIIGASHLYVYGMDQKICLSTDESMIGKTVPDEDERLRALVNGEFGAEYYMHVEESGFWENPSYCRLMLLLDGSQYLAICIDADTKQMGLKCEKTIIENTLREASTEYKTSVAAIGSDSGIVLGMTENNEQAMEIEGLEEPQHRMEHMEAALAKGYTYENVNGERCLMAVKHQDGAYIVAFSPVSDIIRSILLQWLNTLLLFLAATWIVILTIRYNFRKYLLNHFDEMENKLNQILDGDFEVSLEEGNNQDINKLVRVIEKLKMGYIHKSERTDKMLDALGEDIAVFECVFKMDYCFFSDKMQNILGMTDEEWSNAVKHQDELVQLLKKLNSAKDENGIVHYNGKYLEVEVYFVGQELVGVIIDQTEEVTQRSLLETELKRSIMELGLDDMTQVLNRRGFETWVKKYFADSGKPGALIIFDLDNFKNINDNLGHPEGDRVLKIFAEYLKKNFKNGCAVGRIGGDEFTVFVPNPSDRRIVERRIRESLEGTKEIFGDRHEKYGLSASAGIAFSVAGESYEDLYKSADQALYESKKAGKNTYSVYKVG